MTTMQPTRLSPVLTRLQQRASRKDGPHQLRVLGSATILVVPNRREQRDADHAAHGRPFPERNTKQESGR